MISDESPGETDESSLSTLPAHEPPAVDDDPPNVQFSLKTLLVLTTLACAAFALVSRLSVLAAVALLWLMMLMGAHVSGNAWGSRVVAHSTRGRRPKPASRELPVCAPQTQLGMQATLGVSMALVVGVGAIVGAAVGLLLIWRHNHGGLGPTGVVMGAFSSAVIGAFLTFLGYSCIKVSAKAWRQAAASAGPTHSADGRSGEPQR